MAKFKFAKTSEELENNFITNIILGSGILLLISWLWGGMALTPLFYVYKSFQTSENPIVAEVNHIEYGTRGRIRNIEVAFFHKNKQYVLKKNETMLFMTHKRLDFKNQNQILLYVNEKSPKKSVLERRTDILTTFASTCFFIVWIFISILGLLLFIKGIIGLFIFLKKS